MILSISVIIFLVLYAFLILYYTRGWRSLLPFTSFGNKEEKFISVIVPARNEEKNIAALLTALSNQTYPKEKFEVIVVDDFSTDSTTDIVNSFSLANLSLLQPVVEQKHSSKKKSIEAGVNKAKGELIVTTDADCIPGERWLETINNYYSENNAAFIAAPVKFSHNKSLLQIFQALDFLTLQGITAASVAADFHMMCNGANLAYTKEAFQRVKGFEGIDKVATGDDMLLMYKIRKLYPNRVHYLKSEEAIVATQPMPGWKDFFMQRKRWASKTLIYDDYRIIAVLALVYLLNCLFVALIVASLFDTSRWWYVAAFWLAKTAIELPFVYSVSKFYKEQKLIKFLFLFQPLHIMYTVFVGLASQFGKYEWKGRRTK